jgi:hypothetical protein
LFKQAMVHARLFALESAGRSKAARMAMIAMTTSSSMRVKAVTAALLLAPFVRDRFVIIF